MKNKYQETIVFISVLFLLSLGCLSQAKQALPTKVLPCLQFKNRLCIRCPDNTFLKDQQCYQNITNCLQYLYGTNSAQCKHLSTPSKQNNNTSISTNQQSKQINSSSLIQQLLTISVYSDLGSKDQTYQQVNYADIANDTYFQLCDNYMRKGQYAHFISRSMNPIQSVFYYLSCGYKQFKILYQGSGGNLLMSLIAVNLKNNSIILRSFITIGLTRMIQGCVNYSPTMQCITCQDGMHLDWTFKGEKICIKDVPGCVEYLENICIKCRAYQYLVENRCVSTICTTMRDTRSIKYYQNINCKSNMIGCTIQRSYFNIK